MSTKQQCDMLSFLDDTVLLPRKAISAKLSANAWAVLAALMDSSKLEKTARLQYAADAADLSVQEVIDAASELVTKKLTVPTI